jgi:uncharacterized protein YjbI with pentapeptide repeats
MDITAFQAAIHRHDEWLRNRRRSGILIVISEEKIHGVFENVRFQWAEMRKCDFSGSTFIHCNFSDAVLNESNFDNCTFRDCRFHNTKMRHTSLINTTFYNAEFPSADLTFTKLFDAQCEGSNFMAASLRGAMCNLTNFQRCNFAETILTEASFADTDLRRSHFLHTVVIGANLRGAQIDGTNFEPLITLLLADWGECSTETTLAVQRFNAVQLRDNLMQPFVNIHHATGPPEIGGPPPTAWDLLCMVLTEHCKGWEHPYEHPEEDPKSRAEMLKDRELV